MQQLNRTLLCQVEQNFEDFLAMVRVNRACQLLTTTRMTVLDIALEVGYHNAKTLNRSFLKYRLMTPSAYRAGGTAGGIKSLRGRGGCIMRKLYPPDSRRG